MKLWTDDGRTPEHGYTISSPCEPNGSGELIMEEFTRNLIAVDRIVFLLCKSLQLSGTTLVHFFFFFHPIFTCFIYMYKMAKYTFWGSHYDTVDILGIYYRRDIITGV